MKNIVMTGLLMTGLLALPGAPAQARVAECTNAELTASYHRTDASASHAYGRIVLRNTSHRVCTIRGYGGVSYVGGGDGTQVGAAADRTKSVVRTIVLRPGRRVVSPITETSAAPFPKHLCRPRKVDGFRVYLPDETRSQYVPHPTTGCRNKRVHLLEHRAYRRP